MIPPLFAIVELKLIFFLVAIVIYVINHLIGSVKKSAFPKNDPRPDAAPRQPAPSRQQVDSELNDFLRRAAEKRAQAGQQSPAASAANREASRSRKKRQPTPAIVVAQAVEEPLSKRRMVSALEVRDEARAEARPAERRIGQLSQAGSEIGSHVQQVFDRHLGQLGGGEASVSAAPAAPPVDAQDSPALASSIATEISTLLANSQSLRGAIILNEILSRPEHRW